MTDENQEPKENQKQEDTGKETPLPRGRQEPEAKEQPPQPSEQEAAAAQSKPGEDKESDTVRVVLPREEEEEAAAKPKRTIRLKRPGAADEEQATADSGDEQEIPEGRAAPGPKAGTSRIDLSQARAAPTQEQLEGAKEDTARIMLGADQKETPTRAGPQVRTVRISRDAVRKVDAGAQTVVDSEGAKESTSKLDLSAPLPDESHARGPRKTIRIARPDGGAPSTGSARTLRISRTEGPRRATLPTSAEEHALRMAQPRDSERPHAAYAVAALLTLMVAGVLVYVLMTHMPFGAEWPWPGKIITEWLGPPIIGS